MKQTPINQHIENPNELQMSNLQIYLLNKLDENRIGDMSIYDKSLRALTDFLNSIDYTDFGLQKELKLIGYGSYINGFGLKGSDVDTMICTSSFMNERTLLAHIHANFTRVKDDAGFQLKMLNYLLKETVRVPILVF